VETFGHIIDGREEADGATFDSVDPWTRESWATVALGGAAEADRAVASARRAFDEGPRPRMGFAERGAIIHRFADLLLEHVDDLALADTRDMGKPISDARGKDVPRAAQNFRFFADHARLATAETLPMDTGHHAYRGEDHGKAGEAQRAVAQPGRMPSRQHPARRRRLISGVIGTA
jgi:aminomuconate-semialdehyde/2-hydroxymuconate-6-semialdehyde dehydrogenase